MRKFSQRKVVVVVVVVIRHHKHAYSTSIKNSIDFMYPEVGCVLAGLAF